MYLNKKFEDLTFSDDFLFGIIMRNPKYCKPFLETILNVRISRIEYPEGQKTINLSLDAKSIRLQYKKENMPLYLFSTTFKCIKYLYKFF